MPRTASDLAVGFAHVCRGRERARRHRACSVVARGDLLSPALHASIAESLAARYGEHQVRSDAGRAPRSASPRGRRAAPRPRRDASPAPPSAARLHQFEEQRLQFVHQDAGPATRTGSSSSSSRGIHREGPRQRHAPLHAARQFMRVGTRRKPCSPTWSSKPMAPCLGDIAAPPRRILSSAVSQWQQPRILEHEARRRRIRGQLLADRGSRLERHCRCRRSYASRLDLPTPEGPTQRGHRMRRDIEAEIGEQRRRHRREKRFSRMRMSMPGPLAISKPCAQEAASPDIRRPAPRG